MGQTIEELEKATRNGPAFFPDPITLIFSEALGKYRKGAAKYGTFNPVTDTRDLLNEAEAEILDAINYLAMFLMKIRAIRGG